MFTTRIWWCIEIFLISSEKVNCSHGKCKKFCWSVRKVFLFTVRCVAVYNLYVRITDHKYLWLCLAILSQYSELVIIYILGLKYNYTSFALWYHWPKRKKNIHVLSSMKLFFFSSKSKHCLNDWNQASVFVNNYIYSTQKMCIIYKVIGQKSLACEYHACQDINQRKLCRIKQLPCWLLLRLLTSHLILFSEPFCGKKW